MNKFKEVYVGTESKKGQAPAHWTKKERRTCPELTVVVEGLSRLDESVFNYKQHKRQEYCAESSLKCKSVYVISSPSNWKFLQ